MKTERNIRNNVKKYSFKKKNKILFSVEIILMIIMTIFNVGIAFILQGLMKIGINGNVELLGRFILTLVFYILAYGFIAILEGYIKNKYVRISMIQYKDDITTKVLKKDVRDFRRHTIGDYLSIFNNDMKTIEEDCVKGFLSITHNVFLFVFGLLAMIYIDYRVTIVICISTLLPITVSLFFAKGTSKNQNSVSLNNGNYTSAIKDSLSGLTVIKSFNVVSKVYDSLSEKNVFLEKSKEKYNNKVNVVQVMSGLSGYCVIIITFGFSVWLTLKGEMEIASVIAFIQLLNYLLNPIQQLSTLSNKYVAGKAIMNKIDNIISNDDLDDDEVIYIDNYNRNITLEHVCFSYDKEEKKVLSDINLEFEKGKSYAIVGPSGSGKSTLINLIMNYYSNYIGTISMDGVDIRKINSNSLSNLMALIQQDVYIFDDTLVNNIKMFGEYDDKEVDRIIKLAKIGNVVDERGTNYNCGENGSALSGGEKQRISIARALIKNTPILLLDEATSALDNETAQSIENTILSLNETTRIVVMHKMNENILKQYDKIIMMKKGKVVEIGTFIELMEKKGDFYSLYNILQ